VKKVVFALLPLVVLFGGTEALFRLRDPPEQMVTRSDIAIADERLVWRLAPRDAGPLATNELGLRDTPPRVDARSRILLLGDSVSWGHGIDDVRRVYPQVLERRMNERGGAAAVEIVNAGVPGYSTFQELAYLECCGLALSPDALVVQFSLSDVLERYRSLARYGGAPVFLGADTRRSIGGLYGALLRHSRAFAALVRLRYLRARRAAEDDAREAARWPARPAVEKAWATAIGELDGIRALAAEDDLPLLLFVAPYRFQVGGGLDRPQVRLREWGRDRGVPVVDALPLFAGLALPTAESLFNDAGHFSLAGHALVAELLIGSVAGLLEPGASPSGGGDRRGDAEILAEAAASLARSGSYGDADRLLDEAESRRPDLVLVHRYRANVAYLDGRLGAARAALNRALELDPDDALARENLARLDGQ
jgi:lysophospholipase L1-like esterase